MDMLAQMIQAEENRRKAIPSRVFFNHFYAIYYHLESCTDKYDLKKNQYYNQLCIRNAEFDFNKCKQLLWNAWSTEYAFSIAEKINNPDYYKFSLHWNFPQAYYSVYLNMTAFHETQGVANEVHEKSIKLFGNSIEHDHYPTALSFYGNGNHNSFQYHGLSTFVDFPNGHSVLSRIESLDEAHVQIASFLKSTREKNARDKRNRAEKSNDKRFHNKDGEFRKSFYSVHWNLLYQSIPVTTILNMMYRLRIKANYHDVQTFVHADIDFAQFHICLGSIIDYMNFIHEAYICKAIGASNYESIINGFKGHLNDETALRRYDQHIKTLK